MLNAEQLIEALREVHIAIRDSVIEACESQSIEDLSRVADRHAAGDTVYQIDRISEETLIAEVTAKIASRNPVVLIAEGIGNGSMVLPEGTDEKDAVWRIIMDPIDGTRGLMYQKRPAWIMSGAGPNNGTATSIQDVDIAIQTEIPLIKQHLSDCIWAIRGKGVKAERHNRLTGEVSTINPQPSKADTITDGFAMISRFFPGGRDVLAAVDDRLVDEVVGPVIEGVTRCFEDQYVCSGGQLYELMCGHDRFVADLRPLLTEGATGISCHPYDLCTILIAQELGVVITDPYGDPLDFWLDVSSNIAWCGYANESIRQKVEPALQRAMKSAGLL